jgi:hypothetical protein
MMEMQLDAKMHERLTALLDPHAPLRKGDTVKISEVGNMQVMTVTDCPHVSEASPALELVDLTLLVVGVNRIAAERSRSELVELVNSFPMALMVMGPSFITLGAYLGDQGDALRLMALGKVLGLWKIVGPPEIGVHDEVKAHHMAASGFLMITPYKRT